MEDLNKEINENLLLLQAKNSEFVIFPNPSIKNGMSTEVRTSNFNFKLVMTSKFSQVSYISKPVFCFFTFFHCTLKFNWHRRY